MKIFLQILILFIPFLLFSQDFSAYEWEIHNSKNAPFESDFICEIMFDDNDVAWITTSHQKLYSYDGKTWKNYPKPKDWKLHGWFNEILITPEGKFWITGVVGYLISFDPKTGEWNQVEVPEGQPWVIRQNEKGVILIATSIRAGILYQFHEGVFTVIEDRYKDAFEILFSDQGDAYIGFRKGCYQLYMNPDGTYTNCKKKKLSDEAFYDMEFDSKGTLWAASYSSLVLFQYKNNKWKKIPDAPEKIYFDYNGDWKYVIHELVILPDDRVLFSTQFNASIAIYDNKKWEAYNLPINLEDGVGRLKLKNDLSIWCGTWQHGLYIFKPTESPKQATEFPSTIAGTKFIPLNDGEQQKYFRNEDRSIKTIETYTTSADSILIEIRDYKKIDGDIASVIFNGETILDEKELRKEAYTFNLHLQEGYNEFLLFAHNLGEIPPNTAAIKIMDLENKKEIIIDSDFNTCGRILIKKD